MFARKSLIRKTKSPIRNLMMLFFTIMLGFGSVMVMANLDIQTNIQNARQTIMRVTITSDGTDGGNILLDFNTGSRIYISDTILDAQTSFSGKVLGLDANNKIVYVPASGLIVSGATTSNVGSGDTYWTGAAGASIINTNTGNVYIGGTPNPVDTTKLYVTSSGNTQAIFEETNPGNAANIRLKNTVNSWRIGGFTDRFYVGVNTIPILTINSGGNIGINVRDPQYTLHIKNPNGNAGVFIGGTGNQSTIRLGSVLSDRRNLWEIKDQFSDGSLIWSRNNGGNRYPSILMESGGNVGIKVNAGDIVKAALQVSGNVIAGNYNNNAIGSQVVVIGGYNNSANGTGLAIIGGNQHTTNGLNNIIGGGEYSLIQNGSRTSENNGIIGGSGNQIMASSLSLIGGGTKNTITGSSNSFIGGGYKNTIGENSAWSSIVGGKSNTITGSMSHIGGGWSNSIIGDDNNIGGGYYNRILGTSTYSSIIGGSENKIENSKYSTVGGYQAEALHNNVFVRNSDTGSAFSSSKNQTFIINAIQGVGIRTNNPSGDLHIAGSGVLVLSPQVNNPQGGSVHGGMNAPCTITGSIVFENKPCYCDGSLWHYFDGVGYCQF